jgi:hypothetical protein
MNTLFEVMEPNLVKHNKTFFYGTTAHTWALSSSLLRFLNHIQLEAR